MRSLHLPLTIAAGYYSRDCASREKAPFALLPPTTPAVDPSHSFSFAAAPVSPVKPSIYAEVGRYRLRLAQSADDREAACRLRFRVFNIELGEGLERSYETGIDTDHFDVFCEHLLVEDKTDGRVVGTYRMQAGSTAGLNLGYYSAQEFEFAPYEPLRRDILELGRASIDREHRTPEVLTLLWRGIAQYAHDMGLRYLIGCSSLNSKDPAEGSLMYRELEKYRVSPEFETVPTPPYECPTEQAGRDAQISPDPHNLSTPTKVPKLLKTYLTIGARICAPPAWDREFGTIDFLTLLDLKMLSPAARNRFLAPLTR
ncbi:MAG TPA: GNAT family N-acyltransferase [Terracidiphilus sp.]|nr:GNAT family N-acyltransferase [Terracidiphilus sp.]